MTLDEINIETSNNNNNKNIIEIHLKNSYSVNYTMGYKSVRK